MGGNLESAATRTAGPTAVELKSVEPRTARPKAVGIDLGTSHTVVAYVADDDSVRVLPIPQWVGGASVGAEPLLPSCLYAPLLDECAEGTTVVKSDSGWIAGRHAQRRATELPARGVFSWKSWLCHPRIDHRKPVLPWGAEDDGGPRISPFDGAREVLGHVARAWNAAFAHHPLAAQEVTLTVPASFDDTARELVVEAATSIGLRVSLLEEPQAALYDWLARDGEQTLSALCTSRGRPCLVLVVDVGGGTTDLSLVEATLGAGGDCSGANAEGTVGGATGALRLERIAVGPHLLLGGDNMDLSLAHGLAEEAKRLGTPLSTLQRHELYARVREAKERLLSERGPEEARVAVGARGASLVGGSLAFSLERTKVESTLVAAFFPADVRPAGSARSALVGLGLPYERDARITRHIQAFLERHAGGAADAVLFNGGVFRAPRFERAVREAVPGLRDATFLASPHPDLAVARGAAHASRLRVDRAPTILSGAAHAYYVRIANNDGGSAAVCVLRRGTPPGQRSRIAIDGLELLVGQTSRFEAFAWDDARTDPHVPGQILREVPEDAAHLPPLYVRVPTPDGTGPRSRRVAVVLEAELSSIGTLDLYCIAQGLGLEGARHRLTFDARRTSTAPPPSTAGHGEQARGEQGGGAPRKGEPLGGERGGRLSASGGAVAALLDGAFGTGTGSIRPATSDRAAKDLLRNLERVLGPRREWSLETCRALHGLVAARRTGRRASADHERMFWLLAGYTLRPGTGAVGDEDRVRMLFGLFLEKVVHADDARVWQQFWVAWRRAAGGMTDGAQTALRDVLDPFLAPASVGLKPSKKWKPLALDEAWALASVLERVPRERRTALGEWALERSWGVTTEASYWQLCRIGAREPTFGGVENVVPVELAERMLQRLMKERWPARQPWVPMALSLARYTGDLTRDVSEHTRKALERRFAACGATAEELLALREVVDRSAERSALAGESVPLGLSGYALFGDRGTDALDGD